MYQGCHKIDKVIFLYDKELHAFVFVLALSPGRSWFSLISAWSKQGVEGAHLYAWKKSEREGATSYSEGRGTHSGYVPSRWCFPRQCWAGHGELSYICCLPLTRLPLVIPLLGEIPLGFVVYRQLGLSWERSESFSQGRRQGACSAELHLKWDASHLSLDCPGLKDTVLPTCTSATWSL